MRNLGFFLGFFENRAPGKLVAHCLKRRIQNAIDYCVSSVESRSPNQM